MTDVVDIGDLPNDGTGDPLRVAFDKINQNFSNLALLAPRGPTGAFQFKDANALPNGTGNFVYDIANNIVYTGANIVPLMGSNISLGSDASRIDALYLKQTGVQLGNISLVESGNTISFPVTVAPGKNASIHVGNITADGNLSLGGSLELNNMQLTSTVVTTTNNNANQVIYSLPASSFNSGRFYIISRESGGNNSQTVTLNVTTRNDDSTASFNAHGTVFIGQPVTTYEVDVAFGQLRVMVNPFRNISIEHTISYQVDLA